MTESKALQAWVNEVADLCKPDKVYWCDGSEEERQRLMDQALAEGIFHRLNEEKHPNCFLHRSDPTDVARTEHLTFICSETKEKAGATNNWMSPAEARERVLPLYRGAMKGRTLYVIPYLMGPPGSPFTEVGIETTDSLYVVLSMRIMTRMGKVALDQLGTGDNFVKGMHAMGDLSPERRYICHFPKTKEIWSVGSGYGGNALLGKKCFALRIASTIAQRDGWLAEHMLILGIESPDGEIRYVSAAFPSACGKTNLAMLVPPQAYRDQGWKVWTVGDDIAWLRWGDDGRLWAVNPENGFFGVAPGTSNKTNPNALASVRKDSFFTNVALLPDNTVWWEGLTDEPPEEALDWKGNPWHPGMEGKAAHPNSRFTAPAANCPSIASNWEDPQGVPISAMIFGGRRAKTPPLVYQSRSWQHGVFMGATMGSETTAAATGKVGVVRRDPMAMLPFCGYNMADYFGHWLEMGPRGSNPPGIFYVNWFRTDDDGRFLWPGFGENLRVLRWILERCDGKAEAVESPVGFLPAPGAIDTAGLNLAPDAMEKLLHVDRNLWLAEVDEAAAFFEKLGPRVPQGLWDEHAGLKKRLG